VGVPKPLSVAKHMKYARKSKHALENHVKVKNQSIQSQMWSKNMEKFSMEKAKHVVSKVWINQSMEKSKYVRIKVWKKQRM
jgi:hypothetical protein